MIIVIFIISFVISGFSQTSIECTIKEEVTVELKLRDGNYQNGELLKVPIYKSSSGASSAMVVKFDHINTDKPYITGNIGISQLTKIKTEGDHFYMINSTESGNLIIWTYFPRHSTIIVSKQYELIPIFQKTGYPLGIMNIGKCVDLK